MQSTVASSSVPFGSNLSTLAGDSNIAHYLQNLPAHFLTMKVVARVIFAVLLAAIAAMLQGCGCDESAAKSCTGLCAPMTKCLSDAGCCDYEEDGAKMKDLMAAVCLLTPTDTDSCA